MQFENTNRRTLHKVNAIRLVLNILYLITVLYIAYEFVYPKYECGELFRHGNIFYVFYVAIAGYCLYVILKFLLNLLYKKWIIKSLVVDFDCDLHYRKSADITIDGIRELGVFGELKDDDDLVAVLNPIKSSISYFASSEDSFSGTIRNRQIQFCEIKVKEQRGSGKSASNYTYFSAYLLEIEGHSAYGTDILVFTNGLTNIVDSMGLSQQQLGGMGDADLLVYSRKTITDADNFAKHIKKIKAIINDRLGESDFILLVKDDMTRVFVKSDNDRFETTFFKPISYAHIAKASDDINGMVCIAETILT